MVYQYQILLSSPVAHTIFPCVSGKPFLVATAGLWIIAVAYEAIAAQCVHTVLGGAIC